jgi:Mn-dependent DtxR family transcriptional regulator
MPDQITLNVLRLRTAIRKMSASSTNDYMELLLAAGERGHPIKRSETLMTVMMKRDMKSVEVALSRLETLGLVQLNPTHVSIVGYAEMIRR